MDNKIIKFIVYDLNKRDFMLNYACIFKSISNALFSLLHRLIVKFKIPNNFKARYIAFSDSKINYLRGSKFFYSQRMYPEW